MKRKFNLASIIISAYNEEAVLEDFFKTLMPVLIGLNQAFEIICVNDGSIDKTLCKLIDLKKIYPNIKIVDLFRNFGKEAGITAGFQHATGDILIPIDSDLQDPPSLIPLLIKKWEEGFDEVIAVRSSRQSDSWIKRTTANLFYKWFNKISDYKIKFNAGDYRLLDRSIVNVILLLGEKNRFMKGLYSWSTNRNQAVVEFDRKPRQKGKTKWSYWKLWNFALDGITSFSSLPLRIWSYIGVFFSFVSLGYMLVILIKTLIWGNPIAGYPSLMCIVLFMGGIQLLSLGVLGEYIGRAYIESKNRPLYVVKKLYL